MPSQRKRIGFLPRTEVQKIIDQICKNNKLSQSKVTGILVEEALVSRGVLKKPLNNKFIDINSKILNKLLINNSIDKEINNKNQSPNYNYINEEVKMINDYIEFKLFKNLMNKNKKNI